MKRSAMSDMYHHVPDYYRSVSERVSNILDVIGYSQEDRDRKVLAATGHDVFMNIVDYFRLGITGYQYMFGSRGEGSTGPGLNSDRDILIWDDRLQLVADLSDCQPDKINLLMVLDDRIHPGYVKLQLVRMLPDNIPEPVFYEVENLTVDSNVRTLVPNQLRRLISPGEVYSGPARRTLHDTKESCVDSVLAFRCTQWPNEAHEWFQRLRRQGWPASHHLQKARKDGCFAVGVGHPHSHESDLEWRLSFSFTERELIRSFEDTVMKVYVLLKMIKKTYIEPVLGDAFSSYHCKVCMLWVRERTPIELWRTENLLYCLNMCMKQLYEWVSEGHCPDYFIVTNNIYDRKIFGTTQFILTRLLGVLLSEDCRMLLGLECCNLRELLLHDCISLDMISHSRIIRRNVIRETFVDYVICLEGLILCRFIMLREIPQDYNIMTSYIRCIMHALQQAPHTLRIYLHHILMILLSHLGFHAVSVCIANAYSLSQEEVDYLMDLASMCLSHGINSDATSVRLKLCGLGTMFGDCDLTEICLQQLNDHKMRYIFAGKLGTQYLPWCNDENTFDNLITVKYSPEDLLQNQMSFSVVYLPSEIHIAPTPMKMEMFRSSAVRPDIRDANKPLCYELADVDSLMCLYFFQYLNFSRLGKERHQQAALDNMICMMRTDVNNPHRETELNLLGYCFMRESQYINAFICFNKSMNFCPHHNAAKFYLGILFHKIRVARLRHYRN
ncbi:hypothetical protein CHS0354_011200 [Potamilus streckersoni]|uniref:Mab-21-like HhH/H2TH-like domain-containing protein n=1 Tax=Potamilus streckersoni TaxID=2493646 RepID=A0AAE0T2D8_9BIVA|nr:hypothetical protein CHS0354_011200 [Potamilus streckersoni]